MERIALNSGPIGYWVTILWASILVGIGGIIIGAVISGIVAKSTDVDIEANILGVVVVFGTALFFAFLGGFFCRRHLVRIRKMTMSGPRNRGGLDISKK